ncbi:MAG: hypothetical protein JNJ45_03900 [Chthonomonas sp.]|nr:hypothetical protein [Chthonomonas sp.]
MRKILMALSLTAFAGMAMAQPAGPPVKVKVDLPKTISANVDFVAMVRVTLPEGWHAYGPNPARKKGDEDFNTLLSVALTPNKAVSRFMPGKASPAPVAGKNAGEYIWEGDVAFPVTMRVKPGTKSVKLKLNVTHQICDSNTCLPPKTEVIEVLVTVKPAQKASK